MNMIPNFAWLFIILFVFAVLVYLVGRWEVRSKKQTVIARSLAVVAMVLTLFPLYSSGQQVLSGTNPVVEVASLKLEMDGMAFLFTAVLLVVGLLVMIFSLKYMEGEENEEKFYALLLAMIGAMIGLVTATDLFNLWIWFEAMAIASYMLVAFYRTQAGALEAGVKYLVQSAVGSAFILLGLAMVFVSSGSTNLKEMSTVSGYTGLTALAGAFFLIGFGVKSALVPLHTWLPDAHSQAPSGISAMLSGLVIEAGLIAMLRTVAVTVLSGVHWGTILIVFAGLNMLIGNMMALRQKEVKRLLAFSSVSHMGYMLMGLGVAIAYGNSTGAAGAFFHVITHAFGKGLAFLAAGALLYTLHLAKHDHSPLMLSDLNGASKKYPLIALALSIAVLSLGGLPPLAGFMSKWQIFVSGFESQDKFAMGMIIFMALNSVLSLAYYAPMVNRMYRNSESEIVQSGTPSSPAFSIPLALLSLALVVLGFYPRLVTDLVAPAVQVLLAIFQLG